MWSSAYLKEAARNRPAVIDPSLALRPGEKLSKDITNAIYFIASGLRDQQETTTFNNMTTKYSF